MDRWKRLVATMVVAMCGAFSVGHYVGSSSAAGALSDCRAAVVEIGRASCRERV